MSEFWSISNILFSVPIMGTVYNVSLIEFISTMLGVAFVLAFIKESIWAYPLGIVNSVGFIAIFYQIQLYSDLLLNIYFIVISFMGWYAWRSTNPEPLRKHYMDVGNTVLMIGVIAGLTYLLGSSIDTIFPILAMVVTVPLGIEYQHVPAAYPYADAFTSVTSVFAMYLLVRKCVTSWWLWVTVDVVCVWVYFDRGVPMMGLEYLAFLALATTGGIVWTINMIKEEQLLDIQKRVRGRSLT